MKQSNKPQSVVIRSTPRKAVEPCSRSSDFCMSKTILRPELITFRRLILEGICQKSLCSIWLKPERLVLLRTFLEEATVPQMLGDQMPSALSGALARWRKMPCCVANMPTIDEAVAVPQISTARSSRGWPDLRIDTTSCMSTVALASRCLCQMMHVPN